MKKRLFGILLSVMMLGTFVSCSHNVTEKGAPVILEANFTMATWNDLDRFDDWGSLATTNFIYKNKDNVLLINYEDLDMDVDTIEFSTTSDFSKILYWNLKQPSTNAWNAKLFTSDEYTKYLENVSTIYLRALDKKGHYSNIYKITGLRSGF